jgi:hypothetical protein
VDLLAGGPSLWSSLWDRFPRDRLPCLWHAWGQPCAVPLGILPHNQRMRYTRGIDPVVGCVENVIHWCLRGANYWQAVICFGLPIVVIFRLFNYLMFSALHAGHGGRYPALSILKVDVPAVFILSTVWWAFMRFIASRKREG